MICMMIVGFFSCTSSKSVQKTTTKTDSTSITVLRDSLRVLTSEKRRLEEEIRELNYSGVLFDTITVRDTINQVIIKSDGTIEAKGKIKSASFTSDKLTKRISELQREIDSLRLVKNKVRTEYRYITERKDKEKQTVLFPWYLLVIAGAAFLVFWLIKKSK
jgi:flagellar biosynthesis chaperone FliJ